VYAGIAEAITRSEARIKVNPARAIGYLSLILLNLCSSQGQTVIGNLPSRERSVADQSTDAPFAPGAETDSSSCPFHGVAATAAYPK
jgi:hypothetical protein